MSAKDYEAGTGGETHQKAGGDVPELTTQVGAAISDDQNSLKAGRRGPTLIEDQAFREKIFHFDHERIPERVVHARGYGAHGYFETYEDLSDITAADIFQRPGEKTEVFVRFSTVAGSKGSMDLARDVRGFAVKFYTKQGNWDLVGNNIPVFFIQDAIKFPDLIHAAKPEPDSAFPMHMIMWTMSDRAIPRSFRFMEGFGVHSFRFVNAAGEAKFVKFHWKPKLGLQSVIWDEALRINGADPDFHRRDLWTAIQSGDYPEWELGVQVFDDAFADEFDFDVLDATKIIPEELVPVRLIGKMVLNRMPDNFFAETEQVAFQTGNIVPGIDFSNDPLLQGRNFSYLDTQLKRLGSPNFNHIPINAPRCPFHHFQQDGHMAMHNPRGRANYEPNGWGGEAGGPRETPNGLKTHPTPVEGVTERVRSETFADHYSQARQFYISQTKIEQGHIASALIFELSKVKTKAIRVRMVSHLINIHADLAQAVAFGLGINEMPEPADAAVAPRTDLPESPALSLLKNGPKTFAGRKIGILVTEGSDAAEVKGIVDAATAEGAMIQFIGPLAGSVTLSDGSDLALDEMVEGAPSAIFDAVAILPSADQVDMLAKMPAARDFAATTWAHYKFAAYNKAAKSLFAKAGLPDDLDEGFIPSADADQFITACRKLRFWARELAA